MFGKFILIICGFLTLELELKQTEMSLIFTLNRLASCWFVFVYADTRYYKNCQGQKSLKIYKWFVESAVPLLSDIQLILSIKDFSIIFSYCVLECDLGVRIPCSQIWPVIQEILVIIQKWKQWRKNPEICSCYYSDLLCFSVKNMWSYTSNTPYQSSWHGG